MIYVSKEQLKNVEYLIEQSLKGNHILFDEATLRFVFNSDDFMSEDQAYAVEHHIERLIGKSTLSAQKAYLEQLDSHTLKLVVRTYFNIVENNLFETSEVRH